MGIYVGPVDMPVTRFLDLEQSQHEHPFGLQNIELADALGELRNVTQKDWVIKEYVQTKKRFLRSPIFKTQYELFVGMGGSEYQQINFYDSSCKSPFPQPVDGTVVMAYMIGYLAGRG